MNVLFLVISVMFAVCSLFANGGDFYFSLAMWAVFFCSGVILVKIDKTALMLNNSQPKQTPSKNIDKDEYLRIMKELKEYYVAENLNPTNKTCHGLNGQDSIDYLNDKFGPSFFEVKNQRKGGDCE